MSTNTRIQEIDAQLAALEAKKKELEKQLLSEQSKWNEKGMESRLRKAILSRYGSVHPIKLAILKLNGVYNDEYDNYDNPLLMLIDNNFQEMEHDIDPNIFCPSEEEQREMYEDGEQICESVTIRFA